jgi:ferredoxin-thioredoxin reductase catalytic subunit
MKFLSGCRNCPCLHYFSTAEEVYPVKCYCVTAEYSLESCTGYEPKDNLEYLEWINDKKE